MKSFSGKTLIFTTTIVTLTCIVFLFSGCGTNNTVGTPPGTTTTGISVSPSPAITTTSGSVTSQGVNTTGSGIAGLVPAPGQLATIESNAEEAFDNINQGNWSKATQQLTTMKSNFNAVNPLLLVSFVPANLVGELNSAITSLEKNLNSKKTYESSVDANAISRSVISISDKYKTTMPTDFDRLSYYAREIVINGMKSDWTTASSNFAKGKEVWNRVKTLLDSTYKTDVTDFDAILSRVETSIANKTASYTQTDIKAIFDKIDVIRADYLKQTKS